MSAIFHITRAICIACVSVLYEAGARLVLYVARTQKIDKMYYTRCP